MVPEPGLSPAESPGAPPQQPGPTGPAPAVYPLPAWPPGQQPVPGQPYPAGDQPVGPGYQPDAPAQPWRPAALPVTPREYHEFFRTPRFRWWKPLLSLAMFIGTWFLANLAIGLVAVVYDWSTGRVDPQDTMAGRVEITPALFTANNLALAAAIPLAGLTAWAVFGQRPKWISSIAGGFRWSLFWRFAGVAVPILLLSFGTEVLLSGAPELVWNPDSLFLIFVILLTTPFQAAGEEYGVRGILARSIGSWFSSSRVGLVVSTVLTSVVFMLLHGAQDPWLNGYYFGVGVLCSLLVWRTGGLEAGVALHVVNNLIGMVTLPFGGLDSLFDRQAGVAGPGILVQMSFTIGLAAAMWWMSKRRGIPHSAAPAAVQPESWR